MKIAVVDTYYLEFLRGHYRRHALATLPYRRQLRSLLDAGFGTADYYSQHLAALGFDCEKLIINCAPLQFQWAVEHEVAPLRALARAPARLMQSDLGSGFLARTGLLLRILAHQIRNLRPDVLYVQDLYALPPSFLRSLEDDVALVVGQIASRLPPDENLRCYDLILTSFPHYVSRLRNGGVRAEYLRLGFEASLLERVGEQPRQLACSFVGGVGVEHRERVRLLETIARQTTVDFFGYGAETLDRDSAIRSRHRGPAWGLDMYRTLARSGMTLNHHVAAAEEYANNMRLYEATGMGTMLLTDAKANLAELFDVGREVVAYRDAVEAVEQIRYYADRPREREAIAAAGQRRTLREHTYRHRMGELAEILRRHVSRR